MVHPLRIAPKNAVEQADRENRLELRIVVARPQLARIDLAAIKHNPFDQPRKVRDLHFDVVNRSFLVDCFDVQNRQLVVLKILKIVRILDGYVDNRTLEIENRIEQAD